MCVCVRQGSCRPVFCCANEGGGGAERTKCYRCGAHAHSKALSSGAPWCERCKRDNFKLGQSYDNFLEFTHACPLKITWRGPRWRPPYKSPRCTSCDSLGPLKDGICSRCWESATSNQPTCALCGEGPPHWGAPQLCTNCTNEWDRHDGQTKMDC